MIRPGTGFGAIALALLTACAYRGHSNAPLVTELTWFSYLNGDDVRRECAEGAPFRYRFVYNADYQQQIRSYEVIWDGADGALLVTRVRVGGGLALSGIGADRIFTGQYARRSETALGPKALASLEKAMEANGVFGPAPDGLRLYSDQYYWVTSACRDGSFYFGAWLHPSEDFLGLSFPDLLFALGQTEVPVAEPKEVPPIKHFGGQPQDKSPNPVFRIQVGANGLKGLLGL